MADRISVFKASEVIAAVHAQGLAAASAILRAELSRGFGRNTAAASLATRRAIRDAVDGTRPEDVVEPLYGDNDQEDIPFEALGRVSDNPYEAGELIREYFARQRFKETVYLSSVHIPVRSGLRVMTCPVRLGEVRGRRCAVAFKTNSVPIFNAHGEAGDNGFDLAAGLVVALQLGMGRDRSGRLIAKHGIPREIVCCDISVAARRGSYFMKRFKVSDLPENVLAGTIKRLTGGLDLLAEMHETLLPELANRGRPADHRRGVRSQDVPMFELFEPKKPGPA